MPIENRPYVGTWQLNNREVIRYTPDALVYLNGLTTVSGCPTCGGRIDLQRYITTVSVDPTTQGVASASITLQLPRSASHAFFVDGQFKLQTGMEINIYLRGYFPVKGRFADTTKAQTGGIDVSGSVVYPYYHVFHGVVTEVSHEYSGGEHTASLSCSDLLNFWQYHKVATSGSVFGKRPANSKVQATLTGNVLNAMTPYSIVYTMYRMVMGAAGGVDFTLSKSTNVAGNSSSEAEGGQSLWAMAQLYWEKRFSQQMNSLRMYGSNGSLYNAFDQAFLGRLSTTDSDKLVTQFSTSLGEEEVDFTQRLQAAARALGYDPVGTYVGASAAEDAAAGGLGINLNQMQAFYHDISAWGNPALFETEYQSKQDIIEAVKNITGFEFYQDVDGDFVFKPPFFNLDTRNSRAYVIEDIDIISFTSTEAAPEVTMLKATASQFKNLGGTGTDGWIGKSATYIDFRLVAQYGWRDQTFETAYLTDTRAMYYACISRMDILNINAKRAQCQIPMRPELRPGYPVYIRYLDCYFYLQSFNHSFSFGGQCTTSLNLVGRRAKFHAPGLPPTDGKKPTIKNIDLSNPWQPPLPLEVLGNDRIPRLQGFPNVVLGIDVNTLNPLFWVVGSDTATIEDSQQLQSLLLAAHSVGVLELASTADGKDGWLNGPFQLRTGGDTFVEIGTSEQLATAFAADLSKATRTADSLGSSSRLSTRQAKQLSDAQTLLDAASAAQDQIRQVLDAVLASRKSAMPDQTETANYFDALLDLKAHFNPGGNTAGYYRYYSSSHPDKNQQGMGIVVADQEAVDTTQVGGLAELENTTTYGFANTSEGVLMDLAVEVRSGIPIMRPNTGSKNARAVVTPTHQIVAIAFAQHDFTKTIEVPRYTGDPNPAFAATDLQKVMQPNFIRVAEGVGAFATVQDKFLALFNQYVLDFVDITDASVSADYFNQVISTIFSDVRVENPNGRGTVPAEVDALLTVEEQFKGDEQRGNKAIALGIAMRLAADFSARFRTLFTDLVASAGPPGNNNSTGDLEVSPEEKSASYDELADSWVALVVALALDDVADPAKAQSQGLVVYVPGTSTQSQYTPVFPVSDGNGYEVIGTYPYGRGLTIEAGGTMEQLADNPFANADSAAIDEFVAALIAKGSIPQAITAVVEGYSTSQGKKTVSVQANPEAAAALATLVGFVEPGTGTADVLTLITSDPTQFENDFRAFMETSKEFTQKMSVQNAAYGLADLGLNSTKEVCECKGAEADVLLFAFASQGFVSVDQPDDASAWVADRMLATATGWKTSQDALRGRVLDTGGSELFDAFQAAGKAYGIGPKNQGEGIGAEAARGIANAVPTTTGGTGEEG